MISNQGTAITKRIYADIFVDPQWSHCGSSTSAAMPLRSYTPDSAVHFLGLSPRTKVSAFAHAVQQATGIRCSAQDLRVICKDSELHPMLNTRTSMSLEWRLLDNALDPDGTTAMRSRILSTDIFFHGKVYRAVVPLSERDQIFRILITEMFLNSSPQVFEIMIRGLRAFFSKYGVVARIQIVQDHMLDGRGFFSHNEGVVYLVHSMATGSKAPPQQKQTASLAEWNNEGFSWQAYPV